MPTRPFVMTALSPYARPSSPNKSFDTYNTEKNIVHKTVKLTTLKTKILFYSEYPSETSKSSKISVRKISQLALEIQNFQIACKQLRPH